MANAGGIRAGRAFVEVGINDQVTKALARVQARFMAFGTSIQGAGLKLAGVGAAALAPLAGATKTFIDFGDTIQKMALRTGFGAEALSELSYAAGQSGTDLATLENGVRRMAATINDAGRGLSTATGALADLGLAVADVTALGPEKQFTLIADRLSQIEDPSRRAAVAMQVFGRSGTQLLPMLADGARGIEALRQRARELGVTIDRETADKAAMLGDALDDVGVSVRALSVNIGAAFAPLIQGIAVDMQGVIASLSGWTKEHREAVVAVGKLAGGVGGLGVTLVGVGGAVQALAFGVGGFTKALAAARGATLALAAANRRLMAAFAVNPIGAVAIVALSALAVKMTLAANAARELADATRDLTAAGDRQRQRDAETIARLQQLSEKQKLNVMEMEEAEGLLQRLDGRYGTFGATLDTTTGRISGMADAVRGLTDALRAAAVDDLNREILEVRGNIAALDADIAAGEWADFTTVGGAEKTVAAAVAARDAQFRRLDELTRRRAAVRGGNTAAATGTAPGAGGTAAMFGGEHFDSSDAEQWVRRIFELRLQLIEDERDRVNARYDDEERRANGVAETIAAINAARSLELQKLDQQQAKERENAERTIAEEARRLVVSIHELRLQQIEQEHLRAVALINARAAEEKRLADPRLHGLIDERAQLERNAVREEQYRKEIEQTADEWRKYQAERQKAGLIQGDADASAARDAAMIRARDIAVGTFSGGLAGRIAGTGGAGGNPQRDIVDRLEKIIAKNEELRREIERWRRGEGG